MSLIEVLDIDFPLARPKLVGGGSQVTTILTCHKCNRKETVKISIKYFGERRMFGCSKCGNQLEVAVNPKRLSHI